MLKESLMMEKRAVVNTEKEKVANSKLEGKYGKKRKKKERGSSK